MSACDGHVMGSVLWVSRELTEFDVCFLLYFVCSAMNAIAIAKILKKHDKVTLSYRNNPFCPPLSPPPSRRLTPMREAMASVSIQS